MRRVAIGLAHGKTQIIDLDLRAYFDSVRHHVLLEKVAKRIQDDEVLRLLRLILKGSGKKGVPQKQLFTKCANCKESERR